MRCIYCVGSVRDIEETQYYIKFWCPVCRHTFKKEKPQPPKPPDNPYIYFNHQGKGDVFVKALLPKYNLLVSDVYDKKVKFVLTDNDIKGRQRMLERIKAYGCNLFFVYPHAARPSMINDHWSTWEHTTAQFVVNEYHAEVLRAYGYEKPLESIGWHLCGLREFQPKEVAKNVLFCPIHPRNAPQDKRVNAETFKRLYKHAVSGEINLTVRMIGNPEDNGLSKQANVNFVNGRMNQCTDEIDNADVVIGHQTVAWLAVARGTPTVMMGEDMPTHFRMPDQSYQDVKSWNKVVDMFRYPLDILEYDDTMGLLNRAARSDSDIKDWRKRMIGEPFSPKKFVFTIEEYL